MIKVSIIIPVYNVEKYLEECLISVVNQTLQEIEIICINDCSTDSSLDIINEFSGRDNRITVINNNKNFGLSYTRNRGMKLACGEYIYFLDSDDMITKEAMEELYIMAKKDNLDGIFFNGIMIFENEQLKKKCTEKAERTKEYFGILKGQDLFSQFIQNKEWLSQVQRQFWNRNYLLENQLGFYEGIIHEDELFSSLSLLKANRVLCIKDKYFIRRYRENSIITTPISKKNFEGLFICYCQILDFWQRNNFNDYVNNSIELYSLILYERAKSIYKKILDSPQIDKLENGNLFINQLFKLFLAGIENNVLYAKLDDEKINEIKKFENIIIYGAGVVAKEILEILDRNEIGICGFAVSDKKVNPKYVMGTTVYCIDELKEYCEDSIVLVSVIPKYHKDIMKKLEEMNFKNVLLMV